MTLKKMFAYLFGSLVLIAALLAFVSLLVAAQTLRRSNNLAVLFDRLRHAEELRVHLLNSNREWFLARITGDQEHLQNSVQEEEEVRTALMQLSRLTLNEEDRSIVATATRAAENYLGAVQSVMEREIEPTLAYREVNPALRNAYQRAAELAEYSLDEAGLAIGRERADANFVLALDVLVLVLCAILTVFAWVSVRKWIYRPVESLVSEIVHFREAGHHEPIRPQGIAEIREAAEAFNDLTWRLADQRNAGLRFLAGIAHDFKNPLSAIKLSAEMLGRGEWEPEKRREMADTISRAADQLNRMVGDFLDASRIQAGELELARKEQDIRSVVHDAVLLYRQLSERHEIVFEPGEEALVCYVDSTRLSQVLNNVLSNAIKYSPNGGEIRVWLEREPGFAVVHVRDPGIGIPEPEIPKIFEPFRRARLTKETIPGVGLGLSVAKRIVDGHGGRIDVQSRLGQGTTFSVKIPLSAEEERHARAG